MPGHWMIGSTAQSTVAAPSPGPLGYQLLGYQLLGGMTCPRTSPPGFACVCTLMYHSPALNCCACSGVSVASPFIGLSAGLPFSVSQMTGGPFLPAAAGPWKWAMVAGP